MTPHATFRPRLAAVLAVALLLGATAWSAAAAAGLQAGPEAGLRRQVPADINRVLKFSKFSSRTDINRVAYKL